MPLMTGSCNSMSVIRGWLGTSLSIPCPPPTHVLSKNVFEPHHLGIVRPEAFLGPHGVVPVPQIAMCS
ncbi:hypothetical protein KIN20_033461 [Parelaphostrongylus tenuis]|uniref:Uncharacterized protein n=1 Tax=Parelaphostrongylus tenuis TaxID=148309 RepID=A0AAD5WIT5_PARTN|nr:hypothetical protein KIN20_033461 [Parelaphostrongylus tenuis]